MIRLNRKKNDERKININGLSCEQRMVESALSEVGGVGVFTLREMLSKHTPFIFSGSLECRKLQQKFN